MPEHNDRHSLLEENKRLQTKGERRCSNCRQIKRLSRDFSPNGVGHQSRCKECRAKKRRDAWAADPVTARQRQSDHREQRLLESRDPNVPLLAKRDPNIPLLDAPCLPEHILDEHLDEIVAKAGKRPRRVNLAW